MMGFVNFGNPWFLLGLISVAVPVWLHLLFKKTPKPHNFSSLRLIKIATQALNKRSKLKNLILLAIRIAIITLITLACAKPYLGGSFGTVSHSSEPIAFAIILDNSMSMGVVESGIQYFHLAKSKALDILNLMGNLDKGCLILVNDQANVYFSQLTWNMNEIKEVVKNAELSYGATNLTVGVANALEILLPVKNYKKIIYIISDLTKNAFQPLLENKNLLEKIRKNNIEIVFLPVGNKSINNVAITDIYVNKPFLMKDNEANIIVSLINFGNAKVKTNLSLLIQNIKKREIPIEIEPHSQKKIEIPISFTDEGYKEISVKISADSLPLDDVRFLYMPVLPPQRILILKNPPFSESKGFDEDLYLRFAINPLNKKDKTEYTVESRTINDASNLNLASYAAIFLINIRRFPIEFIDNISKYIQNGGFCGIFLGSNIEPEYYNISLLDNLSSNYILPARLHKRVGNAVSKRFSYHLTDINYSHHSFAIFEPEGNGNPKQANFWEFFQTSPNTNSTILAKMSHGLPAIIEEKRGDGYVMLFTFTADTKWTNWPLKTTFLPFLHQTLNGYIAKKGILGKQLRPNQQITIPYNTNIKSALLFCPNNKVVNIFPSDFHTYNYTKNTPSNIIINNFTTPGFYKLVQTFINGNIKEDYFVVNTIPEESNLDKIEISEMPKFIKTVIPTNYINSNISKKVVELKEGTDISYYFLALLALLIIIESFTAENIINNFNRKFANANQ